MQLYCKGNVCVTGADVRRRTKWDDSPLHLVTFALANNNNRQFFAIDALLQAGKCMLYTKSGK